MTTRMVQVSDHTLAETDWAPDGVDLRDGYYVADSFTTKRPTSSRFDVGSQSSTGCDVTDTADITDRPKIAISILSDRRQPD